MPDPVADGTAASGRAARGAAAREALLDRCLAYLWETGFGRLSLREIAAGAGTSHRMLIYHFGGRDGLLAGVVGRIEAEQRQALADLAGEGGDLLAVGRRFWERISDPALAPAGRLFYEIYADALYDRPGTREFRAAAVASWLGPLTDLLVRHGLPPDDAAARARLVLATARGMLLDLLLTGDREAVDAAGELFAHLVMSPAPHRPPPPA